MFYENRTSETDAQARVEELKREGFRAYFIAYRPGVFEVRFWG